MTRYVLYRYKLLETFDFYFQLLFINLCSFFIFYMPKQPLLFPKNQHNRNLGDIKSYSVKEIVETIGDTLSSIFVDIKIRGEISGYKKSNNGHLYFRLKGENCHINAVCFAGALKSISINIEDGMDVLVFGSISTYGSEYQIKCLSIEYAGIGSMMKLLAQRKEKLASMGLFDELKKKPIPPSFMIAKLGLITSSVGSVKHDILHRIKERFPMHISIHSVNVQGQTAAQETIKALAYFHRLSLKDRPDVIIIARGGGSFEDLLCFSDEKLIFAVSASEIPIISAIGHETDVTLLDLVADLRAPTPTAAAEMVTTPTLTSVKEKILDIERMLNGIAGSFVHLHSERLRLPEYAINRAAEDLVAVAKEVALLQKNIYDAAVRHIDNQLLPFRDGVLQKIVHFQMINIESQAKECQLRRNSSLDRIELHTESWFLKLGMMGSGYQIALNKDISNRHDRLNELRFQLGLHDVRRQMSKGYVLLLDSKYQVINRTKNLRPGEQVKIRSQDGVLIAKIVGFE